MIHRNLDMMMKKTKMIVPGFKNLELSRYPPTSDPNLKAWNAADEYLIERSLAYSVTEQSDVLVLNDQFGAITCALIQANPKLKLVNWTDSFLSKRAIYDNTKANGLDTDLRFVNGYHSDLSPDEDSDSASIFDSNLVFNYVFMRVPKHNSLLEFQLSNLASHVKAETIIIAAGMTKEIHNSTTALFEKIIGPSKTSLAKKKARLIYAQVSKKEGNKNEYKSNATKFELKEFGITSYGYPGVFSRDKLDLGCRVLLQYLPKTLDGQKLLDLGCGTGILGTIAVKQNPSLQVTFSDESFLAVKSARKTFSENTEGNAAYYVTDVLDDVEENGFDHILCNPPFHQQNVQTISIANKMFKQSAQKLKASGELRVVANRHLKYRPILTRYFNDINIVSNDPKFMVWLAKSPK